MMFAVTQHKEPSVMKLICAGLEEKVILFIFYVKIILLMFTNFLTFS